MDYSVFKIAVGNRSVNEPHLQRLIKSFQNNYLGTTITVNENYEIIDGQHRFFACKKLGLDFNVDIKKGYGVAEMQILNVNSKNWTCYDYLESYVQQGNKDYIIFNNFLKKYKLPITICIQILGNQSGSAVKVFQNGKLKIKDLHNAECTAESLQLIGLYYKDYLKRSFINAIIKLSRNKDFDVEEFAEKLKTNDIKAYSKVEDYIIGIEQIYNYRKRNKINLRIK